MLTALLATTTSLLFGCGDFLGGLASRRDSPVIVTANSHLVGFVLIVIAVFLVPASAFTSADLWWGMALGIFGGIGVTAMYAAMRVGRMSIVAPITAALSGALPAGFDLVRGTTLGTWNIVGLVLAIGAIIVVSVAPGEDSANGINVRAIGYALLAGTGFGSGFIALSFTSPDSGLWPVLAARLSSTILFGALALLTQKRYVAYREAGSAIVVTGVIDAAANVTLLYAIHAGPLAVASVLSSLYPVVTLLLARVVLGERLVWLQRIGVVAALLAVVLAAVP